jgi:hypothetical protein
MSLFDLHGLRYDYFFMVGLGEGGFPKPRPEGILVEDQALEKINQAARAPGLYDVSSAVPPGRAGVFSRPDSRTQGRGVHVYLFGRTWAADVGIASIVDEITRLFPDNSLNVEFPESGSAVPIRPRSDQAGTFRKTGLGCAGSQAAKQHQLRRRLRLLKIIPKY